MKPKTLKISGLNSFIEEQTIDFSTLIESGLFGIFGPTGSGKSTVLDAITIALYGYNAVARGTKEFINTDMDKVYIGYEFDSMGNKGRNTYKVERSIKKNKSGGINTDFARLALLDEEGNPVKIIDKVSEIDDRIKEIIGLNHQDFTRSVVLPQGKFSEFLKLSGKDRRNMLERILGLEKYGGNLVDKIRRFKRKKEEELQLLTGELSRYEGVTDENIQQLKTQLLDIEKKESQIKNQLNFYEKRYGELNKIWGLQSELNSYLKIKKDLDSRSIEIEKMRNRYEKGKSAKNVKPYLDRYNDTVEDINKNKSILKELLSKLDSINKKLELTEIKYKEIYKKKNDELPLLIERESNAKYAMELNDAVQKLIKERQELADIFTKYSKRISELENKLKKLKEIIAKNNNNIEGLENKSKTLKISSEYREILTKGWNLNIRLKELKKDQNHTLKYIENLNRKIMLSSKELNKIESQMSIKEEGCNQIKNQLNKLESNPPKDNDYILNREIELHRLRALLEETNKNENKKELLEKELKLIYKNKNETQIKIDYLKERLSLNTEKLENAKQELKELEKAHRAGILSLHLNDGSPCPVCGSTSHPKKAEFIEGKNIEEILKIKDGFEESKKEIEKAMYELGLEIKNYTREEDKLKEELNSCIEKLKDNYSSKLKEEIKDIMDAIDNLKKILKAWERSKNHLKNLLEIKEKEKISLEKQSIRIIEGINKDKNRLDEENKRKDEILEKLNKISGSYIAIKEKLKIENIDKAMEEVRKKEEELEKLEEGLKELRNNIKKFDVQKENIEKELNEVKLNRSKVEEAGKEKRGVIDEYNLKIKKMIGDRKPDIFLKEINEKKTNIIEEEEKLRKILEYEKKHLNELREKRVGIEDTNKSLEASMINIEKELKEALKENKLESIKEVNGFLVSSEEIESMEKEINKFDDEIGKVKYNIDRINKELDGAEIKEEDFLKFKEDMNSKRENHRFLLEEIGKKKEKIDEMEKNFKRVSEINKIMKKLQHINDMLSEMFKLVSGNKFVEYVATNHLRYIAKEASKRLMDITNKRYSLELDSNGNFVICDNFNGGVRRDCNTLSGGETFLTSLALALSLSSQIQLKGNSSIEFFFLDEGFGTLDSHLLDTVMTSLERLHKENLSVGIISHVEELKNRVPIKLIVTPSESGLHGTKVAVERN
ncbi:AAA family ATPase [Maledivibacter halophilus]|uniref:Nuclease SbcCD subunit C n=1 Tax=Maledivibacter halophilus TaxID=36842 RepID=A0A1T5JCJ0_9FIRM|nr:SbcC/MukB-like Walker B domain-containing protein [Maledivibacter halophilus]SKC49125.1 exonuclease SbcC [Maledivibacter halophilus]